MDFGIGQNTLVPEIFFAPKACFKQKRLQKPIEQQTAGLYGKATNTEK